VDPHPEKKNWRGNIMPPNPEHDSFGPTEIAVLVGAFHDALQVLGLTNRQNDLAITLVAKIVIDLAEHGETNPHRLQDEAVKQSRKRLAWFGSPAQLGDRVATSSHRAARVSARY
jgi:hypothetical protein